MLGLLRIRVGEPERAYIVLRLLAEDVGERLDTLHSRNHL